MTNPDPTHRPEADLAFIRRVMETARENTHDNSAHLILWGCLLAVAEVATHLVGLSIINASITLVWALAVGLGFAGSSILKRRARLRAPVNSLVDRILGAIWIGFGVAMSVVGFTGIGRSLPMLAWPGVSAAFLGAAFFASSFLPGRRMFRLLATVWWVIAGALLIWPFPGARLVMSGALVAFVAVPGLVLRLRRSTSSESAAIA